MYDSPITATVLPAKGVQKRVLGVESGISRWGGRGAPPKAPGPFGASVPQKKKRKEKAVNRYRSFRSRTNAPYIRTAALH